MRNPTDAHLRNATLPETGFLRLRQVLALIPVSRATWWQGVADGRYPPGVKLSPRCTAWRAEDIRRLIDALGREGQAHTQGRTQSREVAT